MITDCRPDAREIFPGIRAADADGDGVSRRGDPAVSSRQISRFNRALGVKYMLWVGAWVLASAYFWLWWLTPEHSIGAVKFAIVTLALFWPTFMPLYFMSLILNAFKRKPRPEMQGPVRLAMVTTKTPAEPLSVLKETLTAMLRQSPPHDTWLADEDPSPETRAWCAEHGVKISTRKGVDSYHRKEWPRRTRCKEGNLAYFYDYYGYDNYDIVVQLDADHVPQPGYLEAVAAEFRDPEIGYVSAPSICASNAEKSWAARMRLYAEAPFHGPMQAGFSNGLAPLCIGSHYSVRTRALKEVGGLGPELAEDHSTTMILCAGGWRGVHAIDAIAVGAGPASVADMVTQEFQWSRSLITLLLCHTPRYLGSLPFRLKLQFLFCQTWYAFFAFFMALIFALPILALIFDVRFADVTFADFLLHVFPATAVLLAFVYQMRRDAMLRPIDSKVLSWERFLFTCAQWPWAVLGCTAAVVDRVRGGFVDFRVTPKGEGVSGRLPVRVLLPYFLLSLTAMLPTFFVDDLQQAGGFYILTLLNTLIYAVLFLTIVVQHLRENGQSLFSRPLATGAQLTAGLSLVALMMTSVAANGPQSLYALSYGTGMVTLVETKYVVSGAGQAPPGTVKYLLTFKWSIASGGSDGAPGRRD